MATTTTTRLSEETYRRLALDDRYTHLELYDGEPREKPSMSLEHGTIMFRLAGLLDAHLDPTRYRGRVGHGRLRVSPSTYFMPDVMVIPAELEDATWVRPGLLDAFSDPVLLVVEIWSPATGDYDIDVKIPGYQSRGDHEIWRIHPFERTLTAWRRNPDGSYRESLYRGGLVDAESLPGFALDFDALLGRLK
jgi:Uma2 family endonuclease